MLTGAIGMFLALIVFSNAGTIAGWLGDPVAQEGGGSRTGLVIALIAFWVADTMINALQGPTRTLLGDIVPAKQQSVGNAMMAVANGTGKCIGYAVGSFSQSLAVTFGLTAGIALLLSLTTVLTVREEVLQAEDVPGFHGRDDTSTSGVEMDVESSREAPPSRSKLVLQGLRQTTVGLFTMPSPIARCFFVQFCVYFAWMVVFVYGADFVGKDVFGGDADAGPDTDIHKLFSEGVRYANKGLLVMSIISIPVAFSIPLWVRLVGVRVFWGFSLAVFSVAMLSANLITAPLSSMIMFASLSLALASSFTIPWAIAGLSLEGEQVRERGMHMATFNLAQSLPGVFASLMGGVVVRLGGGDLAYVMMMGGVAALIATVGVIFVKAPPQLQRRKWTSVPEQAEEEIPPVPHADPPPDTHGRSRGADRVEETDIAF